MLNDCKPQHVQTHDDDDHDDGDDGDDGDHDDDDDDVLFCLLGTLLSTKKHRLRRGPSWRCRSVLAVDQTRVGSGCSVPGWGIAT